MKITLFCLGAAVLLAVFLASHLVAALPFPEEWVNASREGGSVLLRDREGGIIAWRVDETESWRMPVSIDDISESLLKTTVAAEDKRFWSHRGVDPIAVMRAIEQNLLARRPVSGASTITMQVMRMSNPQERTFGTKYLEARRALQLEKILDKRTILECYFNLAPYGGNIVGAEAASLRYFGKSASDLTLGEAALLAGIPQSPTRFNPAKHLEAALARREYVFKRMLELGLSDKDEIETARREAIGLVENQHVTDAPHFADYVMQRRGGKGGMVKTTLNPEIQAAVMSASADHSRQLEEMGVQGLAVVVIGIEESELLAMVGGRNQSDPVHGYVNCATSRRQTGSLLKPFIYTAAFATGEITPKSLMYDIPMSWEGYKPQNMDRTYLGPVSAEQALIRSRNIPAVSLLDRLGTFRLAGDASRLGLDIEGGEDRCGLSLALGTAEVSLVDIANAYAALGRLGVFKPLRVEMTEPHGPGKRIYAPGAVYLTLRSLGAPEPGRPATAVWKTGTSWNLRDAWAIALTPDYVVGVWCGNYSGNGHPSLVGSQISLPLALKILDRISEIETETWETPDSVRRRCVCALSGQPASSACPHRVEAEYLPGVSSQVPCRMHRYATDKGERKAVTVWPGNVADFLPSWRRGDDPASRTTPIIEIVSPLDTGRYVIADVAGPRDNLLFSCRTDAGTPQVYWFLNGELYASGRANGNVAWNMKPGWHELIAATSEGVSARIAFGVSEME